MNTAHDPIAQAARLAVQGVGELRDENQRLAESLAIHEKRCGILEAELVMYKDQFSTVSKDRDRLQRFNVELVTQLSNVQNILTDCFERAKDAAFLPNPMPPEQITVTTEIPKFLQNGPAIKS